MKVRPRPPQLCPSLASDFFFGRVGGEGRGRSRILSTKAAAVASVRMVHFRAEYEYVSNHNQEHRSRFPQITVSREAAILGTVYSNWSKESPKVRFSNTLDASGCQATAAWGVGGGLRYRLQKYLTVPLVFRWQEVGLRSYDKGLLMRLKMRGQLGSQLATPQPLHTTKVLFSQSVFADVASF